MREAGRLGTLLVAALFLLQAGGATGMSRAIDQINKSSTTPVPTVKPPAVVQPDTVWVPDRYQPSSDGTGQTLVPGHWERRISPHEVYTPPLTGVNPTTGTTQQYPAGVRPPAEERLAP